MHCTGTLGKMTLTFLLSHSLLTYERPECKICHVSAVKRCVHERTYSRLFTRPAAVGTSTRAV